MNTKAIKISLAIVVPLVAMTLVGWKLAVAYRAPPNPLATATAWLRAVVPQDPLVGGWRQFQAKTCDGSWVMDDHLKSLHFKSDGTFSVTREPFCSYEDAWGKYIYDRRTRQLSLKFTDGNEVPTGDDFDGEGTAIIDLGHRVSAEEVIADRLTLEGIVLFKGKHGTTCGMSLGRVGSAAWE